MISVGETGDSDGVSCFSFDPKTSLNKQECEYEAMISGPARFRDQVKFDLAGMRKDMAERREERRDRRDCRVGGFFTALLFMDIFFGD